MRKHWFAPEARHYVPILYRVEPVCVPGDADTGRVYQFLIQAANANRAITIDDDVVAMCAAHCGLSESRARLIMDDLQRNGALREIGVAQWPAGRWMS